MAKFNTDSNGYTLGFLAIMVVIVGGMLALVSSGLKPIIDKNVELDTRRKILKAILSLPKEDEKSTLTASFVESEYESKVKAYLINYNGQIVQENIPVTYDFRKVMKDKSTSLENKLYPVYEYDSNEGKVYVLQMLGLGLWDEISGYVAFEADKKTIKGVAFDHVGETPGLGSEMVKHKFTDQFKNQSVYSDATGAYDFEIYKAGKKPVGGKGVDGLAGATITTVGIDDMVKNTVSHYSNYLSK